VIERAERLVVVVVEIGEVAQFGGAFAQRSAAASVSTLLIVGEIIIGGLI